MKVVNIPRFYLNCNDSDQIIGITVIILLRPEKREASYFGNENRPPVTTLLATASYPELSYQVFKIFKNFNGLKISDEFWLIFGICRSCRSWPVY